MKRTFTLVIVIGLIGAAWGTAWLRAQPAEVSIVEGFRTVEVASVSDAMEQLYGQRAYMSTRCVRCLPPSSRARRSPSC